VWIIGVGNRYRGDDGAGPAVLDRLAGRLPAGVDLVELAGEPTGLLTAWEGADAVWIVDAVASPAPPGTVHRVEVADRPLSGAIFGSVGSTHALGLADAVEIGRALGQLPALLVVYGIRGRDFAAGTELDPGVRTAVDTVADAVRAEVRQFGEVAPVVGP
jgi:hydrogenase maturation protease